MVAAGAGLLLSASIAIGSTLEALDERQSAAAAMDLRMAATAVAHADQVRGLGGSVPVGELSQSVQVLANDRDLALHALEPDEALEAHRLLDEIRSVPESGLPVR